MLIGLCNLDTINPKLFLMYKEMSIPFCSLTGRYSAATHALKVTDSTLKAHSKIARDPLFHEEVN